jgi:hypothetical protein
VETQHLSCKVQGREGQHERTIGIGSLAEMTNERYRTTNIEKHRRKRHWRRTASTLHEHLGIKGRTVAI